MLVMDRTGWNGIVVNTENSEHCCAFSLLLFFIEYFQFSDIIKISWQEHEHVFLIKLVKLIFFTYVLRVEGKL